MLRKFEYFIIIFLFIIMGTILYYNWTAQQSIDEMNNKILNLEKANKEQDKKINENIECRSDSDCVVDPQLVYCPAEAHCENNKCVTYCVYNDKNLNNLVKISDCLDINPLSVRTNEYSSKWLNKDLKVNFNIVLACNITDINAYYEIKNMNTIELTYEYKIPETTDRCLCVRNVEYTIENLDPKIKYNIIINKVEK